MMFCLGATVSRRIGDPCKMRHQAAKSADSMLLNLPHLYMNVRAPNGQRSLSNINFPASSQKYPCTTYFCFVAILRNRARRVTNERTPPEPEGRTSEANDRVRRISLASRPNFLYFSIVLLLLQRGSRQMWRRVQGNNLQLLLVLLHNETRESQPSE
jgi:hypothetical protein